MRTGRPFDWRTGQGKVVKAEWKCVQGWDFRHSPHHSKSLTSCDANQRLNLCAHLIHEGFLSSMVDVGIIHLEEVGVGLKCDPFLVAQGFVGKSKFEETPLKV